MRPCGSRILAAVVGWIACLGAASGEAPGAGNPGVPLRLDDFRDPALWVAKPAAGVELGLTGEPAAAGDSAGGALRLDFDFRGRGGWAAAARPLAIELPENWELRFRLRAAAPVNDFEVKFVDPSGENVWWMVRREFAFPAEWTTFRVRKRQVSFAWGPAGGGPLERIGALELVVTAGSGGRGSVWIADLELVPLAPERPYAGAPVASSRRARPAHPAAAAFDSDGRSSWRAPGAEAELRVDFGEPREFGALSLLWERDRTPTSFAIDGSDDGASWRELRRVTHGGAGRSNLRMPEIESRWLRLRVLAAPAEVGLASFDVWPLEAGASPEAFLTRVASAAPRGSFPRGFSGEQSYWTVVGVDADPEEALVSEDGAVEVGERGFTLEPFVALDGRLWTWADVVAERTLLDGDLPIPTVAWPLDGLRLETTALATGESGASSLLLRYRLENLGAQRREGRLWLAVRPFQVNPPSQLLTVPGGAAPIGALACPEASAKGGETVSVDHRPRLAFSPAPERCAVQAFDEGGLVERLAAGDAPTRSAIVDATALASAALAWSFDLSPGEVRTVIAAVPFGIRGVGGSAQDSSAPLLSVSSAAFDTSLRTERERWRARLDRVQFDLPAAARGLAQLARASLAWVLVHRDGPAIQPGSRSYARSWIRDGALSGSALLRMGSGEAAREFADWYAPFQAADGQVPCCVDRHGATPVPEHDSHGELIHLVREVQRYLRDDAFAVRMLPHVEAAVGAIERLTEPSRTEAVRASDRPELYGLLPESISHEGYAAKAVHSYWDGAFGYRGLADAAAFAADVGRLDLANRYAGLAERFRGDLLASISRTRARHAIDYLPGSAELGDFDATSSTILLEPGGLGDRLPRAAIEATFERYWKEIAARRDGSSAWKVYTPYELRSIGAFVRLGWRERASLLLDDLLEGRRPREWNQWPEVVSRTLRAPHFLGDLPHGWVATDFVRSFLDLFLLEEREAGVLVLAAGIPGAWLESGETVGVRGLRTPYGTVDVALRLAGSRLAAEIRGLERWPPGGVRWMPPLVAPSGRAWVDGIETPLAADGSLGLALPAAKVEMEVFR
jgi:hypothetical protein